MLRILPASHDPVLGEHAAGKHLAVVVAQQLLGGWPAQGHGVIHDLLQGTEEEGGDIGHCGDRVLLHPGIVPLEIIGVDGVLEVEQIIARCAEVLDHGHMHPQTMPGLVAPGSIGVQQFLQLAGFRQQKTEERTGQGEILHPFSHKVHAVGEKQG